MRVVELAEQVANILTETQEQNFIIDILNKHNAILKFALCFADDLQM